MQKIRIFILAVMSIAISFFCFRWTFQTNCVEASTAPTFYTSAKSAILMETTTGRILFSKNADERRAMASTTKIVTALTVIENCDDLSKTISVPKEVVGTPGTSIYLRAGEKLTIKELLYGLMLQSGNDAARCLAIATSGSEKAFCSLMNKTMQKYGLSSSHFTNPHGLDENEHYTTAKDLATITARALENSTFLEICSTKETKIPKDENEYRYLKNKNKLLSLLDGCIGVKTGYTSHAGRCLVSACERNGLRLVCVVFDCGPMFEESSAMFENAYKHYKMVELLSPNKSGRKVEVSGGVLPFVRTYTSRGFCYPLTGDEYLSINYKYEINNSVKAPIKKSQKIGSVKIFLNDDLLFEENIYTMEEVNVFKTTSWITKIARGWLN